MLTLSFKCLSTIHRFKITAWIGNDKLVDFFRSCIHKWNEHLLYGSNIVVSGGGLE